MAHRKHFEVRQRFNACCGYCGVSDVDAGGEFTVDHYHPVAAGGDNDDDNLVYCCFRCNLYKSDFVPTEKDREAGRIILHPTKDDASLHITLNEPVGLLEPLTESGRFHILLLQLNRPALVSYRLRCRRAALIEARSQLLIAENRELRAILLAQKKYIERLLDMLK